MYIIILEVATLTFSFVICNNSPALILQKDVLVTPKESWLQNMSPTAAPEVKSIFSTVELLASLLLYTVCSISLPAIPPSIKM